MGVFTEQPRYFYQLDEDGDDDGASASPLRNPKADAFLAPQKPSSMVMADGREGSGHQLRKAGSQHALIQKVRVTLRPFFSSPKLLLNTSILLFVVVPVIFHC
jgi:hypothetical protein